MEEWCTGKEFMVSFLSSVILSTPVVKQVDLWTSVMSHICSGSKELLLVQKNVSGVGNAISFNRQQARFCCSKFTMMNQQLTGSY